MTTLVHGVTTVELSDDMLWANEFAWTAVEQRKQYTITGALVVEATAKQSGRPITLAGGEDYGWITYEALQALEGLRDLPGITMTLTLRGVSHAVAWDHEAGAIDARPVVDYNDPDATDLYVATLRFLKV